MNNQLFLNVDEKFEKRIYRFLDLLEVVGKKPRSYAPEWITGIDDIEDRLFAAFYFFGLSQNWDRGTKRRFFEDLGGEWDIFLGMIRKKEYEKLQGIFRKNMPKGHIRRALKGYIYGSPKKGGFKKSYPYSYFKKLSAFDCNQQLFFNRDFSTVYKEIKSIKGVGRTLAFDIVSGAYLVAPDILVRLEPERIYLENSSGPLKGYSMLLMGTRETKWGKLKKKTSEIFSIEPSLAEDTIKNFEKYLVDISYDRLKKVRPSVTRFETLLELEDLICNYQKPIDDDCAVANKFLEGCQSADTYGEKILQLHYRGR